jgi:hypothetical protein
MSNSFDRRTWLKSFFAAILVPFFGSGTAAARTKVARKATDQVAKTLSTTYESPVAFTYSANSFTFSNYDARGRLIGTTDPIGTITTLTYDNLHRS